MSTSIIEEMEVGSPRVRGRYAASILFIQYADDDSDADFNETTINDEAVEEISSYYELEDNWDDEGATAPNEVVIEKAISLVQILGSLGQWVYNVDAGPNGEVMVEIRNEDESKSIEFLFYNELSKVVRFFDGTGDEHPFNDVNEQSILELLGWLNG
jgi:hypothetical protein